MTAEVDIAKLALSNIRAGNINSLDEASLQAQQCKLKYSFVRDFMLRNHPWKFAQVIEPLAVRTDDVHNWAYTYQYPSDCLKIDQLILNYEEYTQADGTYRTRHMEEIYTPDLDHQIKYDVINVGGDKVIVANEPQLRARYRKQITDPNLFDSEFVMAFSWLLAAEIAVPIVGVQDGRQLRADCLKIYEQYLSSAAASDLNETYFEPQTSEFITIRN